MSIEVVCGCGHIMSVPDDIAGGITNCPACRHAVEVPGLRDPHWRFLQLLGVLSLVGAASWAYSEWGLAAAFAVATVAGILLWLLSRAL